MTVNARRTRRGAPAAPEPEPLPEPTPAPEPARRTGSSRRRNGSASRVVAFPEPTIPPNAGPPTQLYSAAPPAASVVPREQPAILHPSDRRSFDSPMRSSFRAPVDDLAIGEIDQTLFDCPVCRRPLALGARRCPGCGTRLIRGVVAQKVGIFIAAGVAIGLAAGVGSGLVAGLAGSAGSALTPSDRPAASASASGGTDPGATNPSAGPSGAPPSPSAITGTMPFVVRSALTQAVATNERLGAAAADLRAELAAARFDASAVAATMRAIAADSVFGEQLATSVSSWSGGGDVGQGLAAFYGTVHDTAVTALENSVQNAGAYKAAARSMVRLLAGRTAVDALIGATANAAGVTLPGSQSP